MPRSPRLLPVAAVTAYVAVWLAASLLPAPPNDLDQFFWPSAHQVMTGHALLMYRPFAESAYPNANGPLSIVPIAGVGLLDRGLGVAENGPAARGLLFLLFAAECLLMVRESLRCLEAVGRPLHGRARAVAMFLFAACPPVWVAVFGYGHVEQPLEVLFIAAATRHLTLGRPVGGGLALGLALLTRTTAVVFLVPLCGYVLQRSGLRAGARDAARCAAAGAATVAVVMTPLLLADGHAVVHALAGYRGALPIWGGSLLELGRGTSAEPLLRRTDGLLIILATAGTTLAMYRRPRPVRAEPAILALLAASAACFPLFAKTVWPYYQVEPAMFATMWLTAIRPAAVALRWAGPLAAFVVANVVTNYGTEVAREGTPHRVVSVVFAVANLAIVLMLVRAGRGDAQRFAAV